MAKTVPADVYSRVREATSLVGQIGLLLSGYGHDDIATKALDLASRMTKIKPEQSPQGDMLVAPDAPKQAVKKPSN